MEGGSRNEYKKGLWTVEEDRILMDYISVHGSGKWNCIAKVTGLKRCGKSCRLRWMNYLSPTVKRGDFSEEEDDLIIRLHKLLGNRWSLIAGRVPGRTDNQVKNHWNTHLSKKLGVKKGKSKARASSRPIFTRDSSSDDHHQLQATSKARASSRPIFTRDSSSDDHHQLQATSNVNINGTTEADEGDKSIKDGSQNGVWFTGMWEMLMDDNIDYETSFRFSSDNLNLHTTHPLEPLQEYCSLDFDFVCDGL